MEGLPAARLYTFVDTGYLRGRDPVDVVQRLCDGGSDVVQLRAKDWATDRIERTAAAMLPVCEANGVALVINDHPEIAARIGAPGVHLGQEDFFDAGHSRIPDLWPRTSNGAKPWPSLEVGLSSHSPGQARRALAAGAAYVAVGPVFATPTKPGRPAVTLDLVRWAAEEWGGTLAPTPWFAIGGITLENLDSVLEAGARRVCVVSAILNAPDIAGACREFRRRLG